MYYQVKPDGHFFDRETMRFFGDTMSNYVVHGTEIYNERLCYVLERKKPVKNGLKNPVYFDVFTFKRVFFKQEVGK